MISLYDEEEVMRSYIKSERQEAAQKAAKKAAKKAAQQATQDKARRMAIRMLQSGKMSLEDIANFTELSLDTVKKLETELM